MTFQTLSAVRRNAAQGASSGPTQQLTFPALLERSKDEIARALPKHLGVERMARIALTAYRMTPKLAECHPMSVLSAVVQASQLGLEIGLLGEAHLVPFKGQCQLVPGYMGLMKLARQSGEVADIYAHEVRENDHFILKLGTARSLEHEPLKGRGGFPAAIQSRGDVVGFYAVCLFKDGTNTFVTATTEDVNAIRDRSRGYQAALKYQNDTPWKTDYVPMGKKTVIRELCKYLPKSPELAKALAMDAAADAGQAQNIDLQQAADGSYEPVVAPPGDDAQASGQQQAPAPAAAAAPTSPRQTPAPTAPKAATKPVATGDVQTPPSQRSPKTDATDAQPKTDAAAGLPRAQKYLADMRRCATIDDLNEAYIRAEGVLDGADLEAVSREYNVVKAQIDGNGSLFGIR